MKKIILVWISLCFAIIAGDLGQVFGLAAPHQQIVFLRLLETPMSQLKNIEKTLRNSNDKKLKEKDIIDLERIFKKFDSLSMIDIENIEHAYSKKLPYLLDMLSMIQVLIHRCNYKENSVFEIMRKKKISLFELIELIISKGKDVTRLIYFLDQQAVNKQNINTEQIFKILCCNKQGRLCIFHSEWWSHCFLKESCCDKYISNIKKNSISIEDFQKDRRDDIEKTFDNFLNKVETLYERSIIKSIPDIIVLAIFNKKQEYYSRLCALLKDGPAYAYLPLKLFHSIFNACDSSDDIIKIFNLNNGLLSDLCDLLKDKDPNVRNSTCQVFETIFSVCTSSKDIIKILELKKGLLSDLYSLLKDNAKLEILHAIFNTCDSSDDIIKIFNLNNGLLSDLYVLLKSKNTNVRNTTLKIFHAIFNTCTSSYDRIKILNLNYGLLTNMNCIPFRSFGFILEPIIKILNLNNSFLSNLCVLLNDKNTYGRIATLEIFSSIFSTCASSDDILDIFDKKESLFSDLYGLLKDKDTDVRNSACRVFSFIFNACASSDDILDIFNQKESLFSDLCGLLKDKNKYVRESACEIFNTIFKNLSKFSEINRILNSKTGQITLDKNSIDIDVEMFIMKLIQIILVCDQNSGKIHLNKEILLKAKSYQGIYKIDIENLLFKILVFSHKNLDKTGLINVIKNLSKKEFKEWILYLSSEECLSNQELKDKEIKDLNLNLTNIIKTFLKIYNDYDKFISEIDKEGFDISQDSYVKSLFNTLNDNDINFVLSA